MAIVIKPGEVGIPFPCAAEAILRGYIYKLSGGQMTKITTVTDTPAGIAVSKSVDADGDAKTMTANEMFNFYSLGCGLIVEVAFDASKSLTRGCAVYTCQSAGTDGTADPNSANSAVKIGHYYGPDVTTSSTAGTCYPVILDVANAS